MNATETLASRTATLAAPGVRLYYEVRGSGPLAVLIGGLCAVVAVGLLWLIALFTNLFNPKVVLLFFGFTRRDNEEFAPQNEFRLEPWIELPSGDWVE